MGRKKDEKRERKSKAKSARKAKKTLAPEEVPHVLSPVAEPPLEPARTRPGLISHTELASADALATRHWCTAVLGWEFGEATATPTGPYHTWRFPNGTGGGIREAYPPEVPGSVPYCEVADIQDTYGRALAQGATAMLAPQPLLNGMGWIAIVVAPGGVTIGLWATA